MTADPHAEDAASLRQAWCVRVVPLSAVSDDDLDLSTTAEERLRFVAVLTREVWALTDAPEPVYDRAHMPIRVVTRPPDPGDRGR